MVSRACQLVSPVCSNHIGETLNARVQRSQLWGSYMSSEKNLLIVGLGIDNYCLSFCIRDREGSNVL